MKSRKVSFPEKNVPAGLVTVARALLTERSQAPDSQEWFFPFVAGGTPTQPTCSTKANSNNQNKKQTKNKPTLGRAASEKPESLGLYDTGFEDAQGSEDALP